MANKNKRTKARREKELKEAKHQKVVEKPIYKRPWIWIALAALVLGITVPSVYQYSEQAKEKAAEDAEVAAAQAKVEPLIWESLQTPLAELGIAEDNITDTTYDLTGAAIGDYDNASVTIKTDVRTIVAQCTLIPGTAAEDAAASEGALAQDESAASDAAVESEEAPAQDDAVDTDAAVESEEAPAQDDTGEAAASDGAIEAEEAAGATEDQWICLYIMNDTYEQVYWSYYSQLMPSATGAAVMGSDNSITMVERYDYLTGEPITGAAVEAATGSAVEETSGAAAEGANAADDAADANGAKDASAE